MINPIRDIIHCHLIDSSIFDQQSVHIHFICHFDTFAEGHHCLWVNDWGTGEGWSLGIVMGSRGRWFSLQITLSIESTGEGHIIQSSCDRICTYVFCHTADAVFSLFWRQLSAQLFNGDEALQCKDMVRNAVHCFQYIYILIDNFSIYWKVIFNVISFFKSTCIYSFYISTLQSKKK